MPAPPTARPRAVSAMVFVLLAAALLAGGALWWQRHPFSAHGGPGASGASGARETPGASDPQAGEGALGPLENTFVDPAGIAGSILTEEIARNFFPPLRRPTSRMMYDPVATIVLRPDREQSFDWPEHPAGRVTFRTNNLGFREDRPTLPQKDGVRILLVGDSHTEGLVNNAENVAHVLERLLEADGAAFEVLNAAVGGTGPREHVGRLRKHLDLRPDLVIAVLYTGNDFSNALMMADFASKRPNKPRDAGYIAMLEAAAARWPKLLPQGFNQVCQFRYWSGDEELALTTALDDYAELAQLCDGVGAPLLAVILPSLPDVQPDADGDTLQALFDALQLDAQQFALNLSLGRRFAAALEERGIPCVDPTDAMRNSPAPLYWRADHHLNVDGHALLALQIHERIRRSIRFAQPAPAAR